MAVNESKKTVLLVDDEPDLLEVYIGIFEEMEEFTYHSASDGLDAYRLARNQKFDLIITDFMMPRLNGVQLVKALRENYINNTTPIVIISAFPDKALIELKSEKLDGNVNIISKPFEVASVERLARKLTTNNSEPTQEKFKMDVAFINPFLSSSISVLKQMAGLQEIEISKPEIKPSGFTFDTDVSSILSIVSPQFHGSMILSFHKSTFLKIANTVLGENNTEVDDSNKDFAGELSNIIFGKTKAVWNEKGLAVEKAIPHVFIGKNYSLPAGKQIMNLTVELKTEIGVIYAAISLLQV